MLLRHGTLYGPGTGYAKDWPIAAQVRRGELPANENGTSFLHVDECSPGRTGGARLGGRDGEHRGQRACRRNRLAARLRVGHQHAPTTHKPGTGGLLRGNECESLEGIRMGDDSP